MRQAKIPILLLLVALLAAPAARAGELSLRAAMARARAQAREVAAAQDRQEASTERLRQARAYRLPTLELQEIVLSTDSPADAFGLTLNQEQFSFPDFVAGDPNDPDRVESFTTRLELSLPLYTGGEIRSRIRQAELAGEAAAESLRWTEDAAALAAAEAYIQLAMARERVLLLERSLDTVDAHVRQARAYVSQGMLVRSELLRAEVEKARLEDLLAQARGEAQVAEAHLSFRLGEDAASDWQTQPLPTPLPLAEELELWLDGAEDRSDLAAARLQVQAAELEEKVQKAASRPRVGFVARLDLVDDQLLGTHGESTTLMAVGRLPLFAGGRYRAAARAARLEAAAAEEETRHFLEAVRLEIRQAFVEAASSRERHHTAQAALEAARETERILGERFRQGVVQILDLLDATNARREAETRELVARGEAHQSILRLAVKAGQRPESAIPGSLSSPVSVDPSTDGS